MDPWAPPTDGTHAPAEIGRALRSIGYEVSARGARPWRLLPRDRIEIAAFRRDYHRALEHPLADETMPRELGDAGELTSETIAAIGWASRHRPRWAMISAPKIQCCEECHFRWEEDEILPYLSQPLAAKIRREHAALLESPSHEAIERHAARERVDYLEAGVPDRLIRAMDADHRAMRRKRLPA